MLKVRRGEMRDVQEIVRLVGCFLEGTIYGDVIRHRPEVLAELADTVLSRGVVFVAELEATGGLVGFIAGVYGAEPIGLTKQLDELAWWIDPLYRRGRTGYYLLRSFEAWAQDAGLEQVVMKAPAGSPVGLFYERNGYRIIESTYVKGLQDGSSDCSTRGGRTRRRMAPRPPRQGTERAADAGGDTDAGGRIS